MRGFLLVWVIALHRCDRADLLLERKRDERKVRERDREKGMDRAPEFPVDSQITRHICRAHLSTVRSLLHCSLTFNCRWVVDWTGLNWWEPDLDSRLGPGFGSGLVPVWSGEFVSTWHGPGGGTPSRQVRERDGNGKRKQKQKRGKRPLIYCTPVLFPWPHYNHLFHIFPPNQNLWFSQSYNPQKGKKANRKKISAWENSWPSFFLK